MPKQILSLDHSIHYLSILDENGVVDHDHEPNLLPAQHLQLYRAMLLGRRFDERMLDLQRQGRIGTFPPIKGQEAAQIGSIAALKESDWLVPSFRETGAEIMRGRTMESILLYYGGFNEGTALPESGKMLPMSIPVASQLLHAVGLGWAAKYRQTKEVVMVFFGDGATSEGDFHEAMNCAAVYQVPVVFVCQNNQWAISIPRAKQTRSTTIAQKAIAYGMDGMQVDGNDILAVYAAAGEAVDRARKGGGPTLIECVTYRVMMHTTADDPSRYRSQEEVEAWRKKDPLLRYRRYLSDNSILTDEQECALDEEIRRQIQQAVDNAEQQMKATAANPEIFDHLFATRPLYLDKQREELRQYLNTRGEVSSHG